MWHVALESNHAGYPIGTGRRDLTPPTAFPRMREGEPEAWTRFYLAVYSRKGQTLISCVQARSD